MALDKKEEMSIEQAFGEIEKKINSLQNDEVSLEDSFKLYKEGMDLLKYADEAIDKVEKQVQKITADGNLETFE
ncbi:MAG: exodeoxyribonuclease VII small subunit [Butyrivibrio sp.]|nr:exodeoxyribonuclease VII small subunit [Butyrivibrio sp.]